jgi:putative ABC transport system ATP-binding protein
MLWELADEHEHERIARAIVQQRERQPIRTTDELLKLFGEINASGQTIVMVTHSVRAASCASRVLFLRDGEVSLELKRGKDTDSQFYQRITDALTQQQTGGECA